MPCLPWPKVPLPHNFFCYTHKNLFILSVLMGFYPESTGGICVKATDLKMRLAAIGLNKRDFASKLGVSLDTAYRWGQSPPKYVMAYLEALEELRALKLVLGYEK